MQKSNEGHRGGIEAKRKYLDPEKKVPHDIHGYSLLSPCLNSHLEIYIVRDIYRKEKKYGQ